MARQSNYGCGLSTCESCYPAWRPQVNCVRDACTFIEQYEGAMPPTDLASFGRHLRVWVEREQSAFTAAQLRWAVFLVLELDFDLAREDE